MSIEDVKVLRERTGAGMMDCKNALSEANGNVEEAQTILRKKGIATADKKSGRAAKEGSIGSYIHQGRIGVMVELACETDFVARSEKFQALLKDLAMHAAASPSLAVRREEVPEQVVSREKEIYAEQMKGKPENIIEKIIGGKVDKFFKENVMLEQPFVKNPDVTVEEHVKEMAGTLKENIQVRRVVRLEFGEAG